MNKSDVAVLKRLRPKVEAIRAADPSAPVRVTERQLQAMKAVAEAYRDRMTAAELAQCKKLGILT
jgi:hypothetical protein